MLYLFSGRLVVDIREPREKQFDLQVGPVAAVNILIDGMTSKIARSNAPAFARINLAFESQSGAYRFRAL